MIIITTRARADLDRLRDFILTDSPASAAKAVERITTGLDLLELFPRAGVVVRSNMRELFIRFGRSAYVVRYRIVEEDVHILRIWHGRENRPR